MLPVDAQFFGQRLKTILPVKPLLPAIVVSAFVKEGGNRVSLSVTPAPRYWQACVDENAPYTSTSPPEVGTYTRPLAIVGGANFVAGAITSRVGQSVLLYSSVATLVASYACRTPFIVGVQEFEILSVLSMAHTIPLTAPFAEIEGVGPGNP